MIALQIVHGQTERQRAITPYLKAIIVDGETHGAARDGVVAMAEGVLNASRSAIGGNSGESARSNTPVEKFRLVTPAETGHP
jgi:hypothetical protein